jgi:hypothetical protein
MNSKIDGERSGRTPRDNRQERLAGELRANLSKRKAQARTREEAASTQAGQECPLEHRQNPPHSDNT